MTFERFKNRLKEGAPPPAQNRRENASIEEEERDQCLRVLRAELCDLRSLLKTVREGKALLAEQDDYICTTMSDVKALMDQLRQANQSDERLRHIYNMWEQIRAYPVLTHPKDFEDKLPVQLSLYMLLDEQLKDMIFEICTLTIPSRLNEWLDGKPAGYCISFHIMFSQQLPDAEDRARLLSYLAWAPDELEKGLVDVENGIIYKYADSKKVGYYWLLLTLAFLAAIAGVLLSSQLNLPIQNWRDPEQVNNSSLLIGWFALLIGITVHVVISGFKSGNRPPIVSVREVGMLITAMHSRIITKLALAFIGFFGFLLMRDVPDGLAAMNTFLVGYGLDSIIELFGDSLERQATNQAAALQKQLGQEA